MHSPKHWNVNNANGPFLGMPSLLCVCVWVLQVLFTKFFFMKFVIYTVILMNLYFMIYNLVCVRMKWPFKIYSWSKDYEYRMLPKFKKWAEGEEYFQ